MPVTRARREFAKGVIDLVLRNALASSAGKSRWAFVQLLWKVQARSDLLRPGRYVGRVDAGPLGRIVNGLLALVGHRSEWLRPAEDWEPRGDAPLGLFSSLAHHLLANYPVPPVLLSGWFLGHGWPALQQQRWFKHVGKGGSLRTAGFPIRLTHRMAHEFAHAPADLPVGFALRWAQIRGMGGTDELARAVASTPLAEEFHGDDFWTTVIRMFINAPRLDPAHVGPIVEYLNDQKFTPRSVIVGGEQVIAFDPPQPDLTVKGRTAASLFRHAAEWRARARPEQPERAFFRWERAAIGEHRGEDEAGAWSIRELLDSDELGAEGAAMHHCVAEYVGACLRRATTIWSLGIDGEGPRRRLLTIEVNPESKQVVQAQMACNEDPDAWCRGAVEDWARREGLAIGW